MEGKRHQKLPDGTTMVDNDPYIVFNDKMKDYARKVFEEAVRLGYKSTEDKARYLTGKIYEMTLPGSYEGSMEKNAIELFDGIMSKDEEKHWTGCIHRSVVQRALLESQGVRTRNNMFGIIPFSYPFKPVKSPIVKMVNDVSLLGKPLAEMGFYYPHLNVGAWTCKDEKNERECGWTLLDATYQNKERALNLRPEMDPEFVVKEDHPKTIKEWKQKYVDSSDFTSRFINSASDPLTKDSFRWFYKNMFDLLASEDSHAGHPEE